MALPPPTNFMTFITKTPEAPAQMPRAASPARSPWLEAVSASVPGQPIPTVPALGAGINALDAWRRAILPAKRED